MIPRAHITAWRSEAPWSTDAQVEQDLVVTRAVVDLYSDDQVAAEVALLAAGVTFDASAAVQRVRDAFISRLPDGASSKRRRGR